MTNNPMLSHIHANAFSYPVKNNIIFDYPPVEEVKNRINYSTVLKYFLILAFIAQQ